ncbi:hypothetical protein [Methylobacterium gregans]|uniref:Uncharacterized protein n=1 Tax=Methylobacterium gregans TaxID=374424 RepID=A0AA37HUN5_9HYPH|nr:hypothetical protein [Methylobacterium gregans]MDQ0524271.1 hypothetical protein [Methylobacterium gregans]GJD82105.1 hypothetical protein NBEOAGPD_5364 [Methylobacterium gregans]GLS57273.1 hypothetical protein GCM10007886_54590 [Methylobacterium gregans]
MTRSRHGTGFEPFADDAAVRTLGALTFENGSARIALHGTCEITRDKAGLALARELRRTAEAIVAALEAQDLPEQIAEPGEPDERTEPVRNPFA